MCDEMIGDGSGDVDLGRLLEAAPAGDAVDFDDVSLVVEGREEIDSCVGGTNGGCSADGEMSEGFVEGDGDGLCSLSNAGAPAISTTFDGGDDPAADDEGADVAAAVVDRFLYVEDPANAFDRAEDSPGRRFIGKTNHAQTHRAEERFDDDILTEGAKGVHCGIDGLADDGLWSREACGFENRGCPGLIDGPFDDACGVADVDATLFESMENVDADDELFERAVRNDASENCGGLFKRKFGTSDAPTVSITADDLLVTKFDGFVSSFAEGAFQFVDMPAGTGGEDRNSHDSILRPIAGFRRESIRLDRRSSDQRDHRRGRESPESHKYDAGR